MTIIRAWQAWEKARTLHEVARKDAEAARKEAKARREDETAGVAEVLGAQTEWEERQLDVMTAKIHADAAWDAFEEARLLGERGVCEEIHHPGQYCHRCGETEWVGMGATMLCGRRGCRNRIPVAPHPVRRSGYCPDHRHRAWPVW